MFYQIVFIHLLIPNYARCQMEFGILWCKIAWAGIKSKIMLYDKWSGKKKCRAVFRRLKSVDPCIKHDIARKKGVLMV